jgi:hypothetical protein
MTPEQLKLIQPMLNDPRAVRILETAAKMLAQAFDTPAQRIINDAFWDIGIERFTPSSDDRWELWQCHKNGWEYTKPPRVLIDRWAAY